MLDLLEALRPRQWVKNLFVLTPVVFAQRVATEGLVPSLVAFGLFCALSSSVYLVNDIVDVDKDRAHPTKCRRPIASGRLSIRGAWFAVALLGPVSIASGALIDLRLAAVLAGYAVLNLAYSYALKAIPYVDVACITAGFVLRVLAGAFAIDQPASWWLVGCTVSLAAFLGFGKRTHELAAAGDKGEAQRAVLARYNATTLKTLLWILAALTLGLYGAYAVSPHAQAIFRDVRFVGTLPFPAFGLARFVWLVSREHHGDSPTDAMLTDIPFVTNLALWGALCLVMLYL